MAHRKPTARRICNRGSVRDDYVARRLEQCCTLDDYITVTAGVLDRTEVCARWDRAPNVGQFRMVIANRMRGEIARERARLMAARRAR